MGLGNITGCLNPKRVVAAADNGRIVECSRGFGRKRNVSSCNEEASPIDLKPLKRRCSVNTTVDDDCSLFEALPLEILIQILCGVDHDDLKHLLRVSKTISEATSIAIEWHFDYNTPQEVHAFRSAIDFDDEIEAPNTPPARRFRSRRSRKNLEDISVALFAEEEQ